MNDMTTEESLEEHRAICKELRDQLAAANDKAKYWETSHERLQKVVEQSQSVAEVALARVEELENQVASLSHELHLYDKTIEPTRRRG
jgi:chromosome segregation ATPase